MRIRRPITPKVNASPINCGEFRQGRGYANWRPTGSGDWLLIYTLNGAGKIVLKGCSIRLDAGDAMLFSPGTEQDYSTDSDVGFWHLRWSHFIPRPHWRPWLTWPSIALGAGLLKLRGSVAGSIGGAFDRMLGAYRLGGADGPDLAMNALEEALIWAARFMADARLAGGDLRVQRATRYLAAHPGRPFRLDRLAAHCGLSTSRLSHLFRSELGTTPQRFSEKLRLDHARQLLAHTNLSIGEISSEVGFDDPFYFSRRFRREFGRAPAGWRRGPGAMPSNSALR